MIVKNLTRVAKIALCKCPKTHNTYGVRFEKHGTKWNYDWAFKVSEQAAAREHYDKTRLQGEIVPGDDYPGCPDCHTKYFVICDCGHLNCHYLQGDKFKCEWCGIEGVVDGIYKGEGISSGGDI